MKDPFTNEEFQPRRSNQKFANSKNRQDYHNENAKKLRKKMAKFDKPRSQNFKIINKLMEDRDTLIESQEFLRGKGFDRSIYNRAVKIKGQTGFVIYDYILIYTDSNVTILRDH